MTTFDPTKPVRTRDGRSARIVCTDLKGNHEGDTIVALVVAGDGREDAVTYRPDGRHVADMERPRDLVNVPEQATTFHALDKGLSSEYLKVGSAMYSVPSFGPDRLGVLKVVMEEGKPVSVELVAA